MTKNENRIRRLTTGPLLIGGFMTLLALMIILEIGALGVNTRLAGLTNDIYRHPLTVSNALRDANTNIIKMHRDMRDVALARNAGELEIAISSVAEHEAIVNKKFELVMERFLGEKSMVEAAVKSFHDWKSIRSEVINLTRNGRYQQAASITKGKGARHVDQMFLHMDELIEFANNKAAEFLLASKNEHQQGQTFLNTMLLAVVLIGVTIAIFVIVRVKNTEEKIIVAMNEAERANMAKSEFLSSMSHDLRTPLNAIIGFSDMMINEMFGPLGDQRYRDYSKDINISGLLLISMVNDILDLSKIETENYEVENISVNLPEIISTALRLHRLQISEKDLEIDIEVPEDLPDLWCDQKIVLQILTNLLSNAVKFTENNGSIKSLARKNNDGSVSLSITDTGIGMSKDELANVIEPFYRGNSHHARQVEGTGLGLHLCKRMAELIDTTMEIESGSGGTTVTLWFPKDKIVGPETVQTV